MNVRAVSVIISTVLIFAILAYISSVALANSMTFEQSVYAADNCDATSTCTNNQAGTGNSQENNCINSSTCANEATGNRNTQSNRCDSVRTQGQVGCINIAEGDRNIQSNACNSVGEFCRTFAIGNDNTQTSRCESVEASCFNFADGNDNTQNILCARMNHCINLAQSSNTQSTVCANGNSCSNDGTRTTVIANGATECHSNGPDTTTFCQPNRVIIRPNS